MWALATLDPGERVPLLGEVISLELTFNTGAALSLLADHTWLVTVIMIAVTVAVVVYARRAAHMAAAALFGAVIGGALGNIADRLLRGDGWGRGAVVDMINYGDLFIGNVADIAIVGAVSMGAIAAMRGVTFVTPPDPNTPEVPQTRSGT